MDCEKQAGVIGVTKMPAYLVKSLDEYKKGEKVEKGKKESLYDI